MAIGAATFSFAGISAATYSFAGISAATFSFAGISGAGYSTEEDIYLWTESGEIILTEASASLIVE